MLLSDDEIKAIRLEAGHMFKPPENPSKDEMLWAILTEDDPTLRERALKILEDQTIRRREGWIAQKVAEREKRLKWEAKMRPIAEKLFKKALTPIINGKNAKWTDKFECEGEKMKTPIEILKDILRERWDLLNIGNPEDPQNFIHECVNSFTNRWPLRITYTVWAPPDGAIGASPAEHATYEIVFKMGEDAFT